MMQIVNCVECGGSTIGLGSTSVNVVLNRSNHCDKCHNTHADRREFFFCSEECFHKYLQKVADGTAKIEWTDYADV
jgi:endogenous inhibitor of DNA gyrase (YacG/DUF329 family)